jgi:Zn-dependent protease
MLAVAPGGLAVESIVLGIVWYVVLLFSLTVHEAAHAWAAKRGGDLTAYHGGQVSLDPTPHLRREPVGTVIVPVLSYLWMGWMVGWASTPYDPAWAYAHPRRAAWMSLAGPASNLFLVLLAAIAIRLGIAAELLHAPASITPDHLTAATQAGLFETVATLLSVAFTLNLLLCIFNLIPLPPLDGSGVLPLFLDDDSARRVMDFMRQPALALGGILVAWLVIGRVFPTLHLLAINLLYPGMGYH